MMKTHNDKRFSMQLIRISSLAPKSYPNPNLVSLLGDCLGPEPRIQIPPSRSLRYIPLSRPSHQPPSPGLASCFLSHETSEPHSSRLSASRALLSSSSIYHISELQPARGVGEGRKQRYVRHRHRAAGFVFGEGVGGLVRDVRLIEGKRKEKERKRLLMLWGLGMVLLRLGERAERRASGGRGGGVCACVRV